MAQRTRSRFTDPVTEGSISTTWSPSGDTTETEGNAIVGEDVATITDTVTKDYRKKIRDGGIVNSRCTMDVYKRKQVGSSSYRRSLDANPTYYKDVEGGSMSIANNSALGNYWMDLVPTHEQFYAEAKAKALSNMDRTPWAFGEDLLEIKETFEFLRNPLKSLKGLLISYKKLVMHNRKAGLSDAKAAANAWTTYRFAVMPLVRSIYDFIEAVQTPMRDRKKNERLNSRGFTDYHRIVMGEETFGSGDTWTKYNLYESQRLDVHAYILYKVTNPANDWRRKYGLRNKDIPVTLWQIVPLSFMIDRVVDISSMLKGLINLADPQIKILAGGVRAKHWKERSFTLLDKKIPGYTFSGNYDTIEDENFSFRRWVWSPSAPDTVSAYTPRGLIQDLPSILDLAAISVKKLKF